jgi:hypothetical protein
VTVRLPLHQRLGFAADARLLIVNCDDVGSSHAANLACEQAMRDGLATSGTLMVPCPWAREAVGMFAELDLGVHLTLTAEYPGYRWRTLTGAGSLHDAEGYMPATVAELYARMRPDDVRRECRAQIEQALDWGVDITHLDSHMGATHFDAGLFEIYLEMAEIFRLPLRMASAEDEVRLGYAGRAKAVAHGVEFPDTLIAEWGRATSDVIRERFPGLLPGVTEINIHPVLEGPELRGYDQREADIRVADHGCAHDAGIAGFVDALGFTRISYRPLRDLQRGLA